MSSPDSKLRTLHAFALAEPDLRAERVKVEAIFEQLPQHDNLTGLASRSRLLSRLDQAIARYRRRGNHFAVLFLDFDRFGVANDSLGHEAGDELLRGIAERLGGAVSGIDTAARLGGAEFVILLEDLAAPTDARVIARKLLRRCAKPHNLRGHRIVSTASIGIVTSERDFGDASCLLRYAAGAMYEARSKGGCCIVEFDRSLFHAQMRRAELEKELRSVIGDEQLEPVPADEFEVPFGGSAARGRRR